MVVRIVLQRAMKALIRQGKNGFVACKYVFGKIMVLKSMITFLMPTLRPGLVFFSSKNGHIF